MNKTMATFVVGLGLLCLPLFSAAAFAEKSGQAASAPGHDKAKTAIHKKHAEDPHHSKKGAHVDDPGLHKGHAKHDWKHKKPVVHKKAKHPAGKHSEKPKMEFRHSEKQFDKQPKLDLHSKEKHDKAEKHLDHAYKHALKGHEKQVDKHIKKAVETHKKGK